jgi:hypothetical protein
MSIPKGIHPPARSHKEDYNTTMATRRSTASELTGLDESLDDRPSHCLTLHISSPTPAILLDSDVLLEHGSSSSLHSAVSDRWDSLIVDSDVIGTRMRWVMAAIEHKTELLVPRTSA